MNDAGQQTSKNKSSQSKSDGKSTPKSKDQSTSLKSKNQKTLSETKNQATPTKSDDQSPEPKFKDQSTQTGPIHVLTRLPIGEHRKTKRKDCLVCRTSEEKERKATVYGCADCPKFPGFCMPCFRIYHKY